MSRRSSSATHERLRVEEPVRRASNRSVGLVFAAVLAIVGLLPVVRGSSPRGWALLGAGVFLAVALIAPRALGPLARAWIAFGLLLHAVVSPVIMAMLYYTTVTPLGLLLRLLGKDLLRLRLDRTAPSYWIDRSPPGPAPHTMRQQF
jgi:hypothetical protein